MEDEMDDVEDGKDLPDEEEEMAQEDSSSDDDEEAEREEHNALERKVVELRKEVTRGENVRLFCPSFLISILFWFSQLSKSPYAYNTHVELIASLKKLGELDQLRHARESMHSIYPLSEGTINQSLVNFTLAFLIVLSFSPKSCGWNG